MHYKTSQMPLWVQMDLENQLIGTETLQTVSVLVNYPLGLKKSYLAVTDKRLIGIQKTWFSKQIIDSPLNTITRLQVDVSIKVGKIIKTLFWGFASLFLFVLIIPVILTILNFLAIWEKELRWTTSGYGEEFVGGKRQALEIIQRKIREIQQAYQ